MPDISTEVIFFATLVVLGLVGNILVLVTVISNAVENRTLPAPDLILANLSFTNLLISILRNIFVITLKIGLNLSFSKDWCRIFMFLWTVLRSMCVWGTFSMSVFHYINIRNLKWRRNVFWKTVKALCGLWAFNCLYFIPALLYTGQMENNVTFSVQIISSTTRPVMGCVWNFPSPDTSLVYVTASLVIHELIPIILMVSTNISTLYTLKCHSRAIAAQKTINRIASERRASLVITILVVLFVTCWGTNVLAVNIFNFTKGSYCTQFLLTLANFGASIFMGFSPLVLLGGHSKLRRKLGRIFCKKCKTQVNPTIDMPPNIDVILATF